MPIIERYRREGLLVTTGMASGDSNLSSFALCQDLFNFDLVAFFRRHQEEIQQEIHAVVERLLSAED